MLPAPTDDVDLTALPVLGLRTVHWRRCHIELKPGVLDTTKLPPLRASVDPMALIAEVLPFTKHGWVF